MHLTYPTYEEQYTLSNRCLVVTHFVGHILY